MVTPVYAALLAFMLVGLSAYIARARKNTRIALGDAGDDELKRRVRAQGNFVEYAPMFLILLGFAEHGGMSHATVHLFGIWFVLGRCLHAYSLLKDEQYRDSKFINLPKWRIAGMISTFTPIALLAVTLIVQAAR